MSRAHPKAKPPARPMERYETVRQEIIALLERFGPMTARELSSEVSVRERDVYDHLEHIRTSLRKTRKNLSILPAECRKCGYTFTSRRRLTKPGKCPQCRSTSIAEPEFTIQKTTGDARP